MLNIFRLIVEFQPGIIEGDTERVNYINGMIDKYKQYHGAKAGTMRAIIDKAMEADKKVKK